MKFMTFRNVSNSISQAMTVQHIKIHASIKPHALVANEMLVSKNMDTLVFTLKYFYCFEGNVGNMAVTCKHHYRQRASIYHFVF